MLDYKVFIFINNELNEAFNMW